MNVQQVIQSVSLVVYGGLMVAAIQFRRRRREFAAIWLVPTFAILALIVFLSFLGSLVPAADLSAPTHSRVSPLRLTVDLVILALAAFPYLLHRFARSFADRRSAFGRGADAAFVVLGLWTFALPSFPRSGQSQSPLLVAYTSYFLLWWFVLLLSVSLSMWRAGKGHPGVARRRMRLMALAALLMNAALLGSTLGKDASGRPTTASTLITSGLGWLSAAAFWLGFTPPAWLRRLWRSEEETKLRRSEEGLVGATDRRGAAQAIVEAAAALLGGQAAAVLDADGTILARAGRYLSDPAQPTDGLSVVAGQQCRLVVERSRYTPLFGAEEESLVRSLTGHLDLALARMHAFERSEAARLEAQHTSERLQQLVYGISHDLKNPLLTVTGFTGLLAEEAHRLSDDGQMFLERIRASTLYMERLIEDLLRLSRVGRADAELADVDLAHMIEEIARDVCVRYGRVRVECDAALTLRINPVRARQLFTNLIENASRHGGRARLTVGVTARPLDPDHAEVIVADNGVGIPEPFRERVFGLFERLEGFSTAAQGTGVGLTMCRRIVEDISGSIDVLDTAAGTHIRLVLPTSVRIPAEVALGHA